MKRIEALTTSAKDCVTQALTEGLEHATIARFFPRAFAPIDTTHFQLAWSANRISSNIRFQDFERSNRVKVKGDPEAFGKVLTQMAFIDGGLEEVERVRQSIEEIGMVIRYSKNPFPHVDFPRERNKPINVSLSMVTIIYPQETFSTGLLAPESAIYHELIHVIQLTKCTHQEYQRMWERRLKSNLLGLISGAVIGAFFLRDTVPIPIITGSLAGSITFLGLRDHMGPIEAEAIIKSALFKRAIFERPMLGQVAGKLFSYTPKNNI